ncbi:ABC transporter permease [Campylobacter molothri]|uniref:ABC transporter permease n=1 Tax=Campylobacter molothri TaxID=1032242 RepID=UPI00301D0D55|nr:FtsX-like permease family protein [Campylobacter sp. W0067]MBZ7961104.1 FtsX-like permease family protein [Campylobacter sp. RM9930]
MENRFFLNELFKSLSFSYQRLFIIILSIFIGALTCSAFLNIYFDIDIKLSKELKAYGANVIISPKNIDENFISNAKYEEIKQKLKARALTPFLYEFLNLGSTSAVVLGTDFKALKLTKPFLDIKDGSFSLRDFNDNSIFLGIDLAKQLGLKVGNELQIYNPNNGKSVKLIIKAIFSSNDEFDSIALASLNVIQNLSDTQGINYANAIVDGNFQNVWSQTQAISDNTINAKPISSVSLSENLVLKKIKTLMFLIVIIVLIIVTTSVNTTLSSIIFSRKKEIALRLALGAKKSEIFKLFASECFIVSLIASIIGAFCGIFLANIFGYLIFNSSIDFRFKAVLISIIISLAFAFFAAFLPIKKALKINICDNLKGD